MKKRHLFKKCLSLVMALMILGSVCAPVYTAAATTHYDYVALGDITTTGFGLEDPSVEAYYVKVAELLQTEDYFLHAEQKYRVEELRYLLDNDFAGDSYTAQNFTGLRFKRTTVQNLVANTDKLSISVGTNNFTTYIVEQMMHYLQNEGAVKYAYSLEDQLGSEEGQALLKMKEAVTQQLLEAAGKRADAVKLVDFFAETVVYAYVSYIDSFNGMLEKVYELNPDADVYILGMHNHSTDLMLTYTPENGDLIDVNVGNILGAVVELANLYAQAFSPYASEYTYVNPGNPKLFIDQMADTTLSQNDRIPTELKVQLMDMAGDTVVQLVQEMFREYGIEKTDKEAYAIAQDIAACATAQERLDYIRGLIQGEAVDEVLVRFKEKLESYTETYSSITLTEAEIEKLLNDLEAAADADGREGVATDFVVDLITKAMVGQTIAGIYIATQQDAYDAIALLEKNSNGDPDALKEAAAQMIMDKVEAYGLDDVITEADVMELLGALDGATETAARRTVIEQWMNDLMVERITAEINDILGDNSYTPDKAQTLLDAMEAAAVEDRAAIAKQHLLTEAGLHNLMVTEFEKAYADNDLGTKPQTKDSFDALVSAVENAADVNAAKALVRAEIRAAAAARVEADAASAWSNVKADKVVILFADMDAKATDAEKNTVLRNWLLTQLDLDETDPQDALAIRILVNETLQPMFREGYDDYNAAAIASEDAFGKYFDGVNKASAAFADYISLKDTAAQQILTAYEDKYKGAGEVAQKYYKDYISLRDSAVSQVLQGYDEYKKAVDKGLESADQLDGIFDTVFTLLCDIAEVDGISLNHLLAIKDKMEGGDYIADMVDNLIQGDPLAAEDKTVAYLALRYYLADSMMIFPNAEGHTTIAEHLVAAMLNTTVGDTTVEDTRGATGGLAKKVADKTLNLYKAANALLKLPNTQSGQIGTLINPDLYVALGDTVTAGATLASSQLAYPTLVGKGLAMEDDGDRVCNYAMGGIRTQELLMLLDDSYNGDAYTADRFSGVDFDAKRNAYLSDIAAADLVTIQIGINDLTTYPITQALRAYNGLATYEMDWERYIGKTYHDLLKKGKNEANRLIMGLVNNDAKCKQALDTATAAVESLFYGFISYMFNMDAIVEEVSEINTDGTIVLVGFYNPLYQTYFYSEKLPLVEDNEINTSALSAKVMSLANRYLSRYCAEDTRCVNVDIRETELNIADYAGVSTDLSTLELYKTVTVQDEEIDILVPQYFLRAARERGDSMHPNYDGHVYIRDQILKALRYNFEVDVILDNASKYYGDEDPAFTFTFENLPSDRTLAVTPYRDAGTAVGDYVIDAAIGENTFAGVLVTPAVFTILPREATITLTVVNGVPSLAITGILDSELTALNAQAVVAEDNKYYVTYDEAVASNYALTVSGEGALAGVAKIGDTYYQDLQSAINAAQDGQSIDLIADITTEPENFVLNKTVKIYLNGHTLWTTDVSGYVDNTRYVEMQENNTIIAVYKKIEITVEVEDVTVQCGEAMPTFTATVKDSNGTVLNDVQVSFACTATDTNTVGEFTITASVADGRYLVVGDATGTLTVRISDGSILNPSVGISLRLESEVFINFDFKVEGFDGWAREDMIDDIGLLVFHTKTASSADSTFATADRVMEGGEYDAEKDIFTVRSHAIPAKDMGDSAWYKMYVKLADGSYVYSGRFESSPKKYCTDVLITKPEKFSEELKPLCMALMNYGAKAQVYFAKINNYSYTELMNASFADCQHWVEDFDSSILDQRLKNTKPVGINVDQTKFTKNQMFLSLEGAIEQNFVFTTASAFSEAGMVIWDDVTYAQIDTLTLENASDIIYADASKTTANSFTVKYKGTPAKKMGETIMVSGFVKIGDVYYYTPILGRSIDYFADDVINDKTTEYITEFKDAMKAMAVYGEYAKEYFNRNQEANG